MPIKSGAIFNEEQRILRERPPSDTFNHPLIRYLNPSHPRSLPQGLLSS
jgi:hypothetical protein